MFRYRLNVRKKILAIFIITTIFIIITGCFSAAKQYDLVVYSGEPEGVAAAVTAAREGINTLLIMNREKPGGLMTYGALNFLDINNAPDGKNLNKGFFEEWHQKVGGNTTFSVNKAFEVFQDMLEEENLSIYKNAELIDVYKENRRIEKIIIDKSGRRQEIKAKFFIDASQNADLSVNAEVPYFIGGADVGLPERQMAATLMIHLDGVEWSEVEKIVKTNKYGPSYINRDNAWGFVKIGQIYEPRDPSTGLRGLNIAVEKRKGEKSEVYVNALHIFGLNPADDKSIENAYQRGKEEAFHVVDFLRESVSGFENVEILPFPEELYVRESRHIISRKQLKVEDVLNNRVPFDTVALASYPLDYQASSPEYNGFVLCNPYLYGISLRSLQPENIDNLFVVGRSSGFSSLAAASARVLPTGMSTAEGVSLAVSHCVKHDMEVEELTNDASIVNSIQDKLEITNLINKYENFIDENLLNYEKGVIQSHVEYLASWGFLIGGYQNEYQLQEKANEKEFAQLLAKGLIRQQAEILYEWVPGGLETMSKKQLLTRDRAAMLLMVAISKRVSELEIDEYFEKAVEYGLIPDIIKNNIKENRILTKAEAYTLLSTFLQKYPPPEQIRYYRNEL